MGNSTKTLPYPTPIPLQNHAELEAEEETAMRYTRKICVKDSLLTSPAQRPYLQKFQFTVQVQLTEQLLPNSLPWDSG